VVPLSIIPPSITLLRVEVEVLQVVPRDVGTKEMVPPLLPQRSDSRTCPFCRREIQGREAVSIYQARAAPQDAEEPRDSSGLEDREWEPVQVRGPHGLE
jgi:hypothetical protein